MGLLARNHPDAFRNISTLIIVAGRSSGRKFFIGDKGPVADFNFENDVDATRLMLEAARSTRVILAGFELTSQVCITAQDLEVIAARNNPVATYFHRNSLAWCNWWTDQFPNDAGFHPWDSAAIALLKHPEYFVMEERGWAITARPKGPAWLECDPALPGPRIHYCTGFMANGKQRFVADVVGSVY
jgi:inosine-uridine nucleoside N-ribohydrolase